MDLWPPELSWSDRNEMHESDSDNLGDLESIANVVFECRARFQIGHVSK